MTVIITEKSQLEGLARAGGVSRMPFANRIVFDLDGPSRARQLAWERRINAYLDRCGCTAGAVVTLASLAVMVAQFIRTAGDHSIFTLAWLALAAVFASLLLGFVAKLVALLVTHVQLRFAVARILNDI